MNHRINIKRKANKMMTFDLDTLTAREAYHLLGKIINQFPIKTYDILTGEWQSVWHYSYCEENGKFVVYVKNEADDAI